MPVLLLAQGDADAKDLLRKAIEARYGPRPPVLDSLLVKLRGRANVKIGPFVTWIPLALVTQFRFPTAMRWDYAFKPFRLQMQSGVTIINEMVYHSRHSDRHSISATQEDDVRSMRRRLWAMAAVLLTPLSDYTVTLESTGSHSLRAVNTVYHDEVEIYLRPDYSLDYVTAMCPRSSIGQAQIFKVQLSEQLITINNLIVPRRITVLWDDQPSLEGEVIDVQANLQLSADVFVLPGVQ